MEAKWNEKIFNTKEEDGFYDRKSIHIKPKDIARTIISFANAEGGTIAVGVEDDKSITGIDGHTKEVNEIRYAPINLCKPSIKCIFQEISVIDKFGHPNHVLLIHVPMSPNVHEDASGDAYCRVGDKSPRMTFNERLLLAYARGEQSYETSPVFGSSIDDIDKNLVLEYMKKIDYSMSFEDYVTENDFVVNKRGEVSVKAILLFGKRPQRYFGRARIRFIRFEGTEELTGAEMNVIKDEIFEGRLLDQLNAAIAFVRTQIKERSFLGKDGLFVTIPEYPEFCWKELIVNAVTHRDYSIVGTDIQIKMFDDKFVVESPGIFAGTITEKNIMKNHFSRNKAIAAYMKEYKFVKEFGEGVKRIYREMAEANLPEPSFKKQDFMTIVTIKNNSIEGNVTERVTERVTDNEMNKNKLTDEEILIDAIKNNPSITTANMAIILNKSRRTVMRIIEKSLKIRRIGSDFGGHWEIIEPESSKDEFENKNNQ